MYNVTSESMPLPGAWYRLSNVSNDKVVEADLDHLDDNGKFLRQAHILGPFEHYQQWQVQRVNGDDEELRAIRAEREHLRIDLLQDVSGVFTNSSPQESPFPASQSRLTLFQQILKDVRFAFAVLTEQLALHE